MQSIMLTVVKFQCYICSPRPSKAAEGDAVHAAEGGCGLMLKIIVGILRAGSSVDEAPRSSAIGGRVEAPQASKEVVCEERV